MLTESKRQLTHLVANGTANGDIDLKVLVVPVCALHTVELRLMIGVADNDVLLVFIGKSVTDVLDSVGARGVVGGVATEDGIDKLSNASSNISLLALVDGLEVALVGWGVEVAIVEAAGIMSVSSRREIIGGDSLSAAVVSADAHT